MRAPQEYKIPLLNGMFAVVDKCDYGNAAIKYFGDFALTGEELEIKEKL